MVEIVCTLEEFHNIIGPKVRNDVATVTKQKKNQLGLICQHCNNKVSELDAAHKHESSRRDIIESILEEYLVENEKYSIPNLQKVLDAIKQRHKTDDVFYFLCKDCHRKYDNVNKTEKTKNNSSKGVFNNLHSLKQVILAIFRENPKKFFTADMLFEVIQERNTKYYSDTLWGLWKQGYLAHPQRKYYQWNSDNEEVKKEVKKNKICFCGDIKKMNQNECDECCEKMDVLTNNEFLK